MDIDQIAKQVQELLAWKAKVGPLLELQMADYEKWKAGQKAGQTDDEEETEEQERERICREADEIRAKEAQGLDPDGKPATGGTPVPDQPGQIDPSAPAAQGAPAGNAGTTDPQTQVGQSATTGGESGAKQPAG